MKQVKFGSFPLCVIKQEDRECLDNYLLKHFSDQISFNDAISNLGIVKNLLYMSPQTLAAQMLAHAREFQIGNRNTDTYTNPLSGGSVKHNRRSAGGVTHTNSSLSQVRDLYNESSDKDQINRYIKFQENAKNTCRYHYFIDASRRAFDVLKDFYVKLSKAPYYKNIVYYPIYIEKVDKVMLQNFNTNVKSPAECIKNGADDQTRYNYNFILLTNDLSASIVNDMKVNEEAVILMLFIYISLFHPEALMEKEGQYLITAENGLPSINRQNLVLLTRFYKLIQKYNLNPVELFFSMYDLLYEARGAIQQVGGLHNLNNPNNLRAAQRNFSVRMREMDKFKHNKKFMADLENVSRDIMTEINRLHTQGNLDHAASLANANIIIRLIERILENNNIYDFIENMIDHRANKESRMEAVADYHKYIDIIKVFEKLEQFNRLQIRDIIVDNSISMGDDIVIRDNNDINNLTSNLYKLKHAINKDVFEDAYYKFILDFRSCLLNNITRILDTHHSRILRDQQENHPVAQRIHQLNASRSNIEIQRNDIMNRNIELNNELNGLRQAIFNGDDDAIKRAQDIEAEIRSNGQVLMELNNRLNEIDQNLNVAAALSYRDAGALNAANYGASRTTQESNELATAILNVIDDSLGYIYEDLQNLFLNPVSLNAILNNEHGNQLNYLIPADVNHLKQLLDSAVRNQNDDNIVRQQYAMLNDDLKYLGSVIINEFINRLDYAFASGKHGTNRNEFELATRSTVDATGEHIYHRQYDFINPDHLTQEQQIVYNDIMNCVYKSLTLRVFARIRKQLQRVILDSKSTIAYSKELSVIHPLLGRLANNVNNFKIYIFNVDNLSTLYNLFFILREKMFLAGIINKPPTKLGSDDLKAKYILNNYLGLRDNPTWLIGQGKIRLQLPDFLSLTGQKLESEIPYSKLKSTCKMKLDDFWKSDNMFNLISGTNTGDNSKAKKIKKDIEDIEIKIKEAQESGDVARVKQLKDYLESLKEKYEETVVSETLGNLGKSLIPDKDNYDEFKKKFRIEPEDLKNNDDNYFDKNMRGIDPSNPLAAQNNNDPRQQVLQSLNTSPTPDPRFVQDHQIINAYGNFNPAATNTNTNTFNPEAIARNNRNNKNNGGTP